VVQGIKEKRAARLAAVVAESEVNRLELDLMESDEDDAAEKPANRYQYRIATTFPHTGGDEEVRARLFYQWQGEKY